MAKKMKLDTTRLKQFALEKGERVGLAVALGIMVLVVGFGLVKGLGARSPVGDIKKKAEQLEQAIKMAGPPQEERNQKPDGKDKPSAVRYDWGPQFELSRSAPDWFDPGAAGDSARRNPEVLRVGDILADGQVKNLTIQYLQGGVRVLAYNSNQKTLEKVKAAGTGGAGFVPGIGNVVADNYGRDLHPTRMVLVTATFPLRDQIEAVRKALHLKDYGDVVANLAEPKFLGLLVYRQEIKPDGKPETMPDGKPKEPEIIYDSDDKGHPIAKGPETRLLLTTADYDDDATHLYLNYLKPGLATPLPQFMVLSGHGNADYPKVELAGIVASEAGADDPTKAPHATPRPGGGGRPAKAKGAAMPQPGGARPRLPSLPVPGGQAPMAQGMSSDNGPNLAPAGSIRLADLAKDQKPLMDKLSGDFNLFDAEGGPNPTELDPQAAAAAAAAAQFSRPANADPSGPEKLLVRFFDADVQPGKTYEYSIQVRMANPNYGKTQDVAYEGLAAMKELLSDFTPTPRITIPDEYSVYVVDIPKKQLESKARGSKGTDTEDVSSERAAIQIQRWADTVKDGSQQYVVADWTIAERLLIHRGEKLERGAVEVELAKWDKYRGANGDFDLASSGLRSSGKAGTRSRPIATIDFYPPDRSKAEVLVDLEGGKHRYSENQNPANPGLTVDDDAAMDLLVLRADGKLAIRTSREDADVQTPTGQARITRYKAWSERISSLRPSNDQSRMPGQP